MRVVRAYEAGIRGADLRDVSRGDRRALQAVLSKQGIEADAVALSADLISRTGGEVRLIEVKHRALHGPFRVPEREMEVFRYAGAMAWLYLVLNTTQPYPVELWVLPDPIRLPWVMEIPASRERGQARGVRHEALFQVGSKDVLALGERVNLDGLDLPGWIGSSRD